MKTAKLHKIKNNLNTTVCCNKIIHYNCFKIICLVVFMIFYVNAYSAEINYINVKHNANRIVVSLNIRSYDDKAIIDAIRRGLDVNVIYNIELIGERKNLFNQKPVIQQWIIHRKVNYDFWKKSYRFVENETVTYYQNDEAVLNALFSLKEYNLPVAMINQPGVSIRCRAELKSIEMLFPINILFKYVMKLWDFKTPWYDYPLLAD